MANGSLARSPSMDSTSPVPILDMSKLRSTSSERSATVEALVKVCERKGFFQVINHGISSDVLHGALDAAMAFFKLPMEDRSSLASEDRTLPARFYSFSALEDGEDKIIRHVLRHNSYPLEEWIHNWPAKPLQYREKMGKYATQIRRLELELIEAITESLGLGRHYLSRHMERGLEMMAVNCYPPRACDDGAGIFGFAAHTDYTLVSVLMASAAGLEELDRETGSWCAVPHVDGSLLVQVGDCLEVVSNGRYRAAVHRVAWGRGGTRVSIANLTSLAMDEKVEVAKELVDACHPAMYRHGGTMREFLEFLSTGRQSRDFVESLKNDHRAV